jgi:hypothetical protein
LMGNDCKSYPTTRRPCGRMRRNPCLGYSIQVGMRHIKGSGRNPRVTSQTLHGRSICGGEGSQDKARSGEAGLIHVNNTDVATLGEARFRRPAFV